MLLLPAVGPSKKKKQITSLLDVNRMAYCNEKSLIYKQRGSVYYTGSINIIIWTSWVLQGSQLSDTGSGVYIAYAFAFHFIHLYITCWFVVVKLLSDYDTGLFPPCLIEFDSKRWCTMGLNLMWDSLIFVGSR